MSTFKLKDYDEVTVSLPDGLSEDQLTSHHPFKNWVKTLRSSLSLQSHNSHPFHSDPYALRSIDVQSFDMFGKPPNQRLGFVKFTAKITNSQSASLPGSVFLRGPSVAMLVILTADDDADEKYVLLTVQPRIAAGSLAFVEVPAGMVDEEGAFVGSAAKEIKEELGLEIKEDSLKDLTELAGMNDGPGREDEDLAQAIYPSPGGSDEYVKIFLHERTVPRKQLGEWTGKLTGLRDDGEKITLKLIKLEDLWREGARDAKCLSALALFDGLKRSGKL